MAPMAQIIKANKGEPTILHFSQDLTLMAGGGGGIVETIQENVL